MKHAACRVCSLTGRKNATGRSSERGGDRKNKEAQEETRTLSETKPNKRRNTTQEYNSNG